MWNESGTGNKVDRWEENEQYTQGDSKNNNDRSREMIIDLGDTNTLC